MSEGGELSAQKRERELIICSICLRWKGFYGRVRAWDGLIMLVKEYSVSSFSIARPLRRKGELNSPFFPLPSARQANALHKSKWIYRGYLHCDSRFVGVWRDTFSEVGSQGAFLSFFLFFFFFAC